TTAPARREPPPLIIKPRATQPAETPAEKPEPVKTAPVKKPATPTPAKESKPFEPVTFQADKFTSHIEPVPGREGHQRRVTVARGNVYLSRGGPESALFLELRSQSAVIFSEKRRPGEKQARSPVSPKILGVETPLEGAPGEREAIAGVYLEGDVVIARGERYMRGPRAYYDFTTDRAIVINPVFRTIQKQRNIPVYIRAKEGRALSARELWFRNAKISTSDFYSPTYHIGTKIAYLKDTTPYGKEGERLGEQRWHAKMKHTTFNIRSIPVFYWPFLEGDFTEGNVPLRRFQVGKHGDFGFGVETEWHLFRLLGLPRPKGTKARLEVNYYDSGVLGGVNVEYTRRSKNRQYTGYSLFYGLIDRRQDDDFGEDREDIAAPRDRGRLLIRHKEFLPKDWTLQFELSYICDRNFLEKYFPNEFHTGKEQETLIYAKKQRDNWAFTTLLKTRLNRFDTQAESAPDLGFYLLGEPLLGDRLTLFSESRAGLKRFRPAKGSGATDSRIFARLDTREELDVPMKVGPVNLVPYVVGRATYWDD
ncbi:MAG: hypothetical protein KAU28_00715, partial [Phycisphaerae bacterium]|nr:hypothetical protein [Phycisphaerae bacterium]